MMPSATLCFALMKNKCLVVMILTAFLPSILNAQNYIFVSSERTDGSISSGNVTGIEAANGICQVLAFESNVLPFIAKISPWKAWLSDDQGNSPANNFTLSSLPYVLPDGTTFVANNYADLTDGTLLNPINQDENGNVLSSSTIHTGTLADGTPAIGNCGNWTSTAATFGSRAGIPNRTNDEWTDASTTTCSSYYSFYCVQQELLNLTIGGTVSGLAAGNSVVLQNNSGDNLTVSSNGSFTFSTALDDRSDYHVTVLTQPTTPDQACVVRNGSGSLNGNSITDVSVQCATIQSGQKYMFVSSEATDGSISELGLTGVAAADAICQRLATSSTILPTEAKAAPWMAWISDSQGFSPLNSFTVSTTDYRLPDASTVVANDFLDLTDGELLNPIDQDENGNLRGNTTVFTGTYLNGTPVVDNCSNWTSTNGYAIIAGYNYSTTRTWTEAIGEFCTSLRPLYCVQQEDLNLRIGGTVTGLAAGSSLVLQNNSSDDLTITSDGIFTFNTLLDDRSDYEVTVLTQPTTPSQICVVRNGSGNLTSTDVTDVSVVCAEQIPGQKFVFATSEKTKGNIREGGLVGVAAADAKCKRLAMASNALPADAKAAPWMAWISDDQGSTPAARFTRSITDYRLPGGSTIVANNYADLTDGTLINPINQDENGNILENSSVYTATSSSGTFNFFNCLNWTNGTNYESTISGYNYSTTSAWTQGPTQGCWSNNSLYCVQQEELMLTIGGTVSGLAAGNTVVLQNNSTDDLAITSNGGFTFKTPLEDFSDYQVTVLSQPTNPTQTCVLSNASGTLLGADITDVELVCTTVVPGQKFIFMTSETTDGSISEPGLVGIEAANAMCQRLAVASSVLPAEAKSKPWMAWLSNSLGASPSTQFIRSQTDYRLPDGATVVANNYADLTDGTLINPIDQDENGNVMPFTVIHTGTGISGTPAHTSQNCSNWTVHNDSNSKLGWNNSTNAYWTDVSVTNCMASQPLYCVQQEFPSYTIGGTVSGLAAGASLVLQNNSVDDLTVTANGSYSFATALEDGSAYDVTLLIQPTSPNQICQVSNESGNLAGGPVTNVNVTCTTLTYTIGGSVTGLATGNSVVIQNNGGDDIMLSSNDVFTFGTALDDGSSYNITVLTQPTAPNQTCEIPNGTGNLAGSNITDISIECTVNTYTIGGSVSGLADGNTVILQNNTGDDLTVSANGVFTFDTALDDESAYLVTVLTQPTSPNQDCVLTNESGNLVGSNVTDINLTCTTLTYTIGGSVTGLATGNSVVIQNNGGDDIMLSSNDVFTFGTALDDGSSYNITVLTQPTAPNQTCEIPNGTGDLAGSNINDISIECTINTYTIGGSVSGLADGNTVILQNNTGDDLIVSANGVFTFDTALDDESAYLVTVLTQPTSPNQDCVLTNDSGNLGGSNVTDINLTCTTLTYTIGGSVTGLADGNTVILQNNTGDDLIVSANGVFTFDTALDDESAYLVTVLTQPTSPNQDCVLTNDSGNLGGSDVTDVMVECTTLTYTIGGSLSGLTEGNTTVLQNNSGDDLLVIANGNFTFDTPLDDGSEYHITVLSQPTSPNQSCEVFDGSGNLAGSAVTSTVVDCVDLDTIFISGFEFIVTANVKALQLIKIIKRKNSVNEQINPEFNTHNSVYSFYGEQLGRDENGSPRVLDEVIDWFEFILVVFDPDGDWDYDKIMNENDVDPFGLLDD